MTAAEAVRDSEWSVGVREHSRAPGYESTPGQIAATFGEIFLGGYAKGVGT